jgi:hypothetical protein
VFAEHSALPNAQLLVRKIAGSNLRIGSARPSSKPLDPKLNDKAEGKDSYP